MKHFLLTLTLLVCLHTMRAQAPADQRTLTTKIADLLARMPALNKEELRVDMDNIAGMGEEGLTEMSLMLAAPGTGDNTRLEFALGSYSYFTTGAGREILRTAAVHAYCKALERTADKKNKAFIIRQLEITGTEDAISCLQPNLRDEWLADPTARALVKIHTANAGKTLLDALKNASGKIREVLVEACGDIHYAPAAASIAPLVSGEATTLNKLSLYALANIGDPASENILANAAEKSGYKYEVTGAMTAYITYARQLQLQGNQELAGNIARRLLKTCTGIDQIAAHTAGLKLLVEIEGEKSLPLLIDALNDRYLSYREAALKFALQFPGKASTESWLKKLSASDKNKEVKGEIITMLGSSGQADALTAVLQALRDKDAGVRLRAITAAGQIGQGKAIPVLLEVLKKDDPHEITAIRQALLVMKGEGTTDAVAKALPSMPVHAKVSLLEVLAARRADSRVNDVMALANSKDTLVRHAALAALKEMAIPAILPQLFPLLLSAAQPGEVRAIQDAIIVASAGIRDSVQHTEIIKTEMKKAPVDKQYLFLDIYAGIGSPAALQVVTGAYPGGTVETKKAVVQSLSDWPNAGAVEALYRICQDPDGSEYSDQAVTGYIHLVSASSYPADQKLLLLRRGMAITRSTPQKQAILNEVRKCKTFIALVFAGNYLDNAELQQQAALAVMEIALSNKAWYGETVRNLLEKTIAVLKGPDSDYQKQGIRKHLSELPAGEGLTPIFNGRDLTGWKGLVGNPLSRTKMSPATLQQAQQKADSAMLKSWLVKDGVLEFSSTGENLCTLKKYGDFEMYVDWKIDPDGDAGIYLRGSPQVQIWDTSRRDVGAQVGSGGLYNNAVYESKPLKLADNAIGEWNNFHIIMKGDRVTVYLNGVLVVNNTILENYWDRHLPIFPEEQIELQAHGRHVSYRDLYVREIARPIPYALNGEESKDGFQLLFDGTNMYQWMGNTTEYNIEDGNIVVRPVGGNHGNLYTKNEYSDFVYRFQFQLTPGANNGIGIRAPLEGDAAYVGMEIQVLDNEADIYRNLHEYQYHGSVYGVIPAKRGYLKPLGEWNEEEITAIGNHIKVVLNGTTILDGDISDAIKNGTLDKKDHPGLKNTKGHLGFLGHGDVVLFRNMRVKDLSVTDSVPAPKKNKKKK